MVSFDCVSQFVLTFTPSIEDYENVGSRYGRDFLWTDPRFYLPIRFMASALFKLYFEHIAGPFEGSGSDNVVEIEDDDLEHSTIAKQKALAVQS